MVCFTVYHAVNGFTFASCILLGIKASTAKVFSRQHYLVAARVLQCYLPVLLIKANVWFRFACWWPVRVTMCASCSICHAQTFFWRNKCVSLL